MQMKISTLDVVKFCLRHPSLLSLAINYRHDKRIDELVEFLVNNRERCEKVSLTKYTVDIEIGYFRYSLWRANRFCAYLSSGGGVRKLNRFCPYNTLWTNKRPSLRHAVAFYKAFDSDQIDDLQSFILSKEIE